MSTKSLLSFVIGAAAGAAAAYFLSSEKTAETREKIRSKAEKELKPLKKKVERKVAPIRKRAVEVLDKVENALENL